MKKILLALFVVTFTAALFSCGGSQQGAQTDQAKVKAEAEAKYAELVRRQNELLQQNGGN